MNLKRLCCASLAGVVSTFVLGGAAVADNGGPEVLLVAVECSTFDPGFPLDIHTTLTGSGTVTGVAGQFEMRFGLPPGDCSEALAGVPSVLASLGCTSASSSGGAGGAEVDGVCDGSRTEMVRVVADFMRAMFNLGQ